MNGADIARYVFRGNANADFLTVKNLDIKNTRYEPFRFDGSPTDVTIENSLTVDNGIYLGGIAAANLLNDYEEGTFTATLTATSTAPITPVTVTAKYFKIGNEVTIYCNFSGISTVGAAGKPRYDYYRCNIM